MAHSKSAIKRIRQNEKRRRRNKVVKSQVKNLLKQAEYAIKNQDKEQSESYTKQLVSALDKAIKKGVYPKNTASRKKSIIMKKLNMLKAT